MVKERRQAVAAGLLAVVTTLCVQLRAEVTDTRLPYPWMPRNPPAKVLRLECGAPGERSGWQELYNLGVSVRRWGQRGNVSLASMSRPMARPALSPAAPSLTQAVFQGTWRDKSASLVVTMPVEAGDYGEYYCSGGYAKTGSVETLTFSTAVTVDDAFAEGRSRHQKAFSVNNFQVKVIDARRVSVTWRPPEDEFLEARVSRTLVDQEGGEVSPTVSLFAAASGGQSLVFEDSGVLLANLSFPAESAHGNYSLVVYVASAACVPDCRFSCTVAYPACYGRHARLCHFPPQPDPPAPQSAHTIGLAVALALLAIVVIGFVVAAAVLHKKGCLKGPIGSGNKDDKGGETRDKNPIYKPLNGGMDGVSRRNDDLSRTECSSHRQRDPAKVRGQYADDIHRKDPFPDAKYKAVSDSDDEEGDFSEDTVHDKRLPGASGKRSRSRQEGLRRPDPPYGKEKAIVTLPPDTVQPLVHKEAGYPASLPRLGDDPYDSDASGRNIRSADSLEAFEVESSVLGAVGGNLHLPRPRSLSGSVVKTQAPCDTNEFHSLGHRDMAPHPPPPTATSSHPPPSSRYHDHRKDNGSQGNGSILQGPIPKLEEFEYPLANAKGDSFESGSFSTLPLPSSSSHSTLQGEDSASRGYHRKKPASKR